jgi:hypothetical protein
MRLLLSLLLLCLTVPSVAGAQDATPPGELSPKDLRRAIFELPKDDPAVAFARDLRLEGSLVLGGAIGLAGGMLGAALGDLTAARPGRRIGPALVGVSLGVALGMAAIGVAPLLDGQRFLGWYATHDRPPTRLARLKLLHRWRIASLNSRRIAGSIGSGFLGATAIVSTIVWISRDVSGVNSSSATYDPTDAIVTSGLWVGFAGALTSTLLSQVEFAQERNSPHRLYAPKAAAMISPVPVINGGEASVGLVGSLTIRY